MNCSFAHQSCPASTSGPRSPVERGDETPVGDAVGPIWRCGALRTRNNTMRTVFSAIKRFAQCEGTVLIEGESGTGKELAARAVHDMSPRALGPFVTVDCGAIPRGTLESELFGHVRGSFTGAVETRIGLFEEASGGTIFLDEIGELPLDLQAKLLRVLESRQLRRVGENGSRPCDVRVVAATNRVLREEVAAGRFREDLYFRLSVVCVRLAPLRERPEDISLLLNQFLIDYGAGGCIPATNSHLLRALREHLWPGNVRELRNVAERIALFPDRPPHFYLDGAKRDTARAGTGSAIPLHLPFHQARRQWMHEFERKYLQRWLVLCDGNISELARVSGLSRQSCHRILDRHDIRSGGEIRSSIGDQAVEGGNERQRAVRPITKHEQ